MLIEKTARRTNRLTIAFEVETLEVLELLQVLDLVETYTKVIDVENVPEAIRDTTYPCSEGKVSH